MTAIPVEIAMMSVADISTFCSGRRRAKPTSEVAAASSQKSPSSQPRPSEDQMPSRSVTHSRANATRTAMNTGLCAACAQGDGGWAMRSANTSSGAGLNNRFIIIPGMLQRPCSNGNPKFSCRGRNVSLTWVFDPESGT